MRVWEPGSLHGGAPVTCDFCGDTIHGGRQVWIKGVEMTLCVRCDEYREGLA